MNRPVIKKKVFVSWLLSYWVILLCSLLASLLIYSSATNALNAEIEKVELAALENTQSLLDSRLMEVEFTATFLRQDNDLIKFAHEFYPFYKSDIAMSMADGKQRMVQAVNNNQMISEIYLYSLRSQATLSSRFGLNHQDSYKLPSQNAFGLDYESFIDMLVSSGNLPQYVILPSIEAGQPQPLLLIYPLFGNSVEREGVLVIKLDTAYILDQVSSTNEQSNLHVIIVDQTNQQVFKGEEESFYSDLQYETLELGAQAIKTQAGQFLVSTAVSTRNDWKYVIVSNLDSFQANLKNVRNMMIIFIAGFMLIGTAASIGLARRNYTPIKQLLSRASQLTPKGAGQSANEFQQLETAIQDIYREKESYSKLLDRQKSHMQGVVLSRLLKGRVTSSEQVVEMLASEDITFQHDSFVLIMMSVEDYGVLLSAEDADPSTVEAVELAQGIIKNVLEELFAEFAQAFVFEMDDFSVCLVNTNKSDDALKQIRATLKKGLEAINQYFQMVITAGISDLHTGMINAARCNQEAQEVLETTRMLHTPGTIGDYQERVGRQNKLVQTAMNLESRRQLLNYLVVEDFESAMEITGDILNTLENSNIPSTFRRIAQSGLIEDLSAALDSVVGEMPELRNPAAEQQLADMVSVDSLSEFRQAVLDFYQELIKIRQEKDSLLQHDVKLSQIIDYIQNNLSDFNLSVSSLADAVGLSVSQVTRLMRGKFGQGTLDYIQRSRVEQAKKLLIETDLNMSEISRSVGYENFRTMNSVFKKFEGITGTQFREKSKRSRH